MTNDDKATLRHLVGWLAAQGRTREANAVSAGLDRIDALEQLAPADALPRHANAVMQRAGVDAMFEDVQDEVKRKALYKVVRRVWRAMFDVGLRRA